MLRLMNEILLLSGCEPIVENDEKASKPKETQNPNIIGDKDTLGECFDSPEYENNPYSAIYKILTENKPCYISRAIYKEGLGWIGFAYGWANRKNVNKGFGLIHILLKHGLSDLYQIPQWIDDGEIDNRNENIKNKDRICITGDGFNIALALNKDGTEKTFIITGYSLSRKKNESKT